MSSLSNLYSYATSVEYMDVSGFFSLTVPADWLAETAGQPSGNVIFLLPKMMGSFRANLNISVQPLAPLSREEFITLSRLQLKHFSGNCGLSRDESLCGLEPAHLFEWVTAHLPPTPVHGRQLLYFDHLRAYVLTAMAAVDQFESFRPEFEAALSSFRLTAAE